MASSIDFVEFVCEQVASVGVVRNKKMFGEYMVYIDEKPIILICDDTAFVKVLPETTAVLGTKNRQAPPYKGARPHYVLDVDDRDTMQAIAKELIIVTALPKKKK